VLVEAVAAPGATSGALSIVTDMGRRYAIGDPSTVLSALGYGGVVPVQIPAGVVSLIPAGAGLDAEAARQPVPVG